ncbi:ABC transporter permease [Thermocrinis sp.]
MGLRFAYTVIAIFVLLALLADFIAPYPYNLQNRQTPYHPPTVINFVKDGRITFPFVHKYELKDPLFKVYEKGYLTCGVELFRNTQYGFKLFSVKEPCGLYIFGTDKLGRDVFSRLVYGARVSMVIGLVGVLTTFVIGSFVGGVSGLLGGRVDATLMRLVEVLLSIPTFYLMLSLRSVLPLEMGSFELFLAIVFILSFVGWAGLARVIRGMVLSLREKEFVYAAKTYGAGTLRILFKHVLPNTYYYLIVSATLSFPGFILGESALSLLGLGVQEPVPSWGNMLSEARNIPLISAYPWILTPGVALFMVIFAFNLLGDQLLKKRT